MKHILIGLGFIVAGFALARLVPASHGPAVTVSAKPESIKSKSAAPVRAVAPDSFSLEGDWRPQAEAWAERNPAEFYKWLVERGIPPGSEVLRVLFQAWIRQDVDAAFTAAFNLPGDFQRQDNVLDAMLGWTLAAPGGLRAALRWIPRAEEQLSSWSWPGEEWMKSGPPQEIAALLAETSSATRFSGTMIDQFAAYWAGQDMPAAMDWVKHLSPAQQGNAFSGLMKTWAKADPQAALHYLATEATTNERFHTYLPLREIAKTDPKAALDWWENNMGVANSDFLNQIFNAWNENAATEARDYAFAIEDAALRRHTLEAWGETAKVSDVLQALGQTPAGPDRGTLLRGRTERFSFKPEETEAIRKLVASPSNVDITPAMAASVSLRYAYRESQAALEWTTTLPEALQAESARSVVKAWKDKVAAAQAVENLPDGPVKTAAQEALKPKSGGDPF